MAAPRNQMRFLEQETQIKSSQREIQINLLKDEIEKLFKLIDELSIANFADTRILLENASPIENTSDLSEKKLEKKFNSFIDKFPPTIKKIYQLTLKIDDKIQALISPKGEVTEERIKLLWSIILPEDINAYPGLIAKALLLESYFSQKREIIKSNESYVDSNSASIKRIFNFFNSFSKLKINLIEKRESLSILRLLKETTKELEIEKNRTQNKDTITEFQIMEKALKDEQIKWIKEDVTQLTELEMIVERAIPNLKGIIIKAEKERQQIELNAEKEKQQTELKKSKALTKLFKNIPELKRTPSGTNLKEKGKSLERKDSGFFPSSRKSISDSQYPLPLPLRREEPIKVDSFPLRREELIKDATVNLNSPPMKKEEEKVKSKSDERYSNPRVLRGYVSGKRLLN